MIYAYKKDNKWYGPVSLCSRFNGIGGWHKLTDEQRATHGWYPAVLVDYEYDYKRQRREGPIGYSLSNGVVAITYIVIDKSRSEIEAYICDEVNKLRDEKLSRFEYDFGEPYCVLAIQLRDAKDRTDWLTLDSSCGKMVAAGVGDTPVYIRTETNITVPMTALTAATMLSALASYGSSIMERSWEIKDSLPSADDPFDVDITAGW